MSTAADRLRAKNANIIAAKTEGNPTAAASTQVRSKPVRVTVDLPPAAHAALVQWCAETAIETGHPRVSNQAVLRALVTRLSNDSVLAEQIRHDISTD